MTRPKYDYDPAYLQSIRELAVLLLLFLVFAGWSIIVSYFAGYQQPSIGEFDRSGLESPAPQSVAIVLGMPAWVFWGIALPWIAADIVIFWYCFRLMKSDNSPSLQSHAGDHDPSESPASTSEQSNE